MSKNRESFGKRKQTDLAAEILASFALRGYHRVSKLLPALRTYKKILFAAFLISFVEVVFSDVPSLWIMIPCIVVFTAGIVFAFVAAGFHMATGFVLRKLAKKYEISMTTLLEFAQKTLDSKNKHR